MHAAKAKPQGHAPPHTFPIAFRITDTHPGPATPSVTHHPSQPFARTQAGGSERDTPGPPHLGRLPESPLPSLRVLTRRSLLPPTRATPCEEPENLQDAGNGPTDFWEIRDGKSSEGENQAVLGALRRQTHIARKKTCARRLLGNVVRGGQILRSWDLGT